MTSVSTVVGVIERKTRVVVLQHKILWFLCVRVNKHQIGKCTKLSVS